MAGIDGNVLLYLRGDSAKDLSRYNNTITNNTSTIAAEGPLGKAISMGSGKYMHIACERSISADEDLWGLRLFSEDTVEVNITLRYVEDRAKLKLSLAFALGSKLKNYL